MVECLAQPSSCRQLLRGRSRCQSSRGLHKTARANPHHRLNTICLPCRIQYHVKARRSEWGSIQRVRVDGVAYRRLLPSERPAAVLNLALPRRDPSAVVGNFSNLVRRAARDRRWTREGH